MLDPRVAAWHVACGTGHVECLEGQTGVGSRRPCPKASSFTSHLPVLRNQSLRALVSLFLREELQNIQYTDWHFWEIQ